jgi:hypothetical protein
VLYRKVEFRKAAEASAERTMPSRLKRSSSAPTVEQRGYLTTFVLSAGTTGVPRSSPSRQEKDERFGLDGKEGKTLRQVAKELGVSRECVRQIEARALRRLCYAGTRLGLRKAWIDAWWGRQGRYPRRLRLASSISTGGNGDL